MKAFAAISVTPAGILIDARPLSAKACLPISLRPEGRVISVSAEFRKVFSLISARPEGSLTERSDAVSSKAEVPRTARRLPEPKL